MAALATVLERTRQLASNKGHVRLFVLVSIVWIAIAAPVFWKPLPYLYDDLAMPFGASPPADPAAINLADRRQANCTMDTAKELGSPQGDRNYDACAERVKAQVESEVTVALFRQLAIWIAAILLIPLILPLLLFGLSVVIQWVKDGYGSKPSSPV